MKRRAKVTSIISIAVVCFAAFLSGCSSSIFTDSEKNPELTSVTGDGTFNKACSGMDLGGSTLSVDSAKKLVNCFNASGGIQAYADLVNGMKPDQLQTVVDVINEELFLKSRRLRELDQSVKQLDERGKLDPLLLSSADVLEHTKLVRSVVTLLRQTALVGRSQELDPAFLQAIKLLAKDLAGDATGEVSVNLAKQNLDRAFGVSARTLSSKAWKQAVFGLATARGLRDPAKNLPVLANLGLEYVKSKIRAPEPLLKTLLWGIEDGSFQEALDQYNYHSCEGVAPGRCAGKSLDLDAQVAALEEFVRVLVIERREEVLRPMVSMFRELNGPVSCMGGTKRVPNLDLFVLGEMTSMDPLLVPDWVMRTNALKIATANGLCDFPSVGGQTFNEAIRALRWLAAYPDVSIPDSSRRGRPLVTVAHFTHGLEVGESFPMSPAARDDIGAAYPENERYRRFLIQWLGDRDTKVNAYTHLADALAELSRPERAVLGNAIYLLNVAPPGSRDRIDLRAGVRSLMTLHKELAVAGGGAPGSHPSEARSVYDVLSSGIERIAPSTFVALLGGVSDLIDAHPGPVVEPLLLQSREAMLMNNVNPILEVILDLASTADKRKALFETLLNTMDTDTFERTLKLTSTMARKGTLKEFLQGILVVFRRAGGGGGNAPALQAVAPVRPPESSYDKSTENRPPWHPTPAKWPMRPAATQACYDVNVDVHFGDTGAGKVWDQQMRNIAACTNAYGDLPEFQNFVDYGLDRKIEGNTSVLAFLTRLLSDVLPSKSPAWDEFSDLLVNPATRKDLEAFNSLLPFLFEESRYCEVYDPADPKSCPRGANRISVFQGLSRVLAPVASEGPKIQKVLDVAKDLVASPKSAKAAAMLYSLNEMARKNTSPVLPEEKPPLVSIPINAYPANTLLTRSIDDQFRRWYGRLPTETEHAAMIESYWNQPQNHTDRRYKGKDGKIHYGYANVSDFKNQIRPLLDELSIGDRLEGALRFFHYMDDSPYNPEWWASWFRRAAAKVVAIPYYYPGHFPGKEPPAIRLVSELDALELVVLDGDFTLEEYGQFYVKETDVNFAVKYLTMLGESAEGPDPSTLRPTLEYMRRDLEFFSSLANGVIGSVGMVKPEIKRRLFNLEQVYPMLRGMNRQHEYQMSDGRRIVANDLGVLRDLFRKVLDATPPEKRKVWKKDQNSMSVIIGLVQAGILRAAGVNMWTVNRNPDLSLPVNPDDDDPVNRRVVPAQASTMLRFLIKASMVRENGKIRVNRDARDAIGFLLREDCDGGRGASCSSSLDAGSPRRQFDERYRFLGKVLNEFFEWTSNDDVLGSSGGTQSIVVLKRAGYRAVQLLDRLAGATDLSQTEEVYRKLARVFAAAVGNQMGSEFLSGNLGSVKTVLNDPQMVHLLDLLLASETSNARFGDREYSFAAKEGFADLREISNLLLDRLSARDADATHAMVDLAYKTYITPSFEQAKAVVNGMWNDPDFEAFKKEKLDRLLDQFFIWLPKETSAVQPRELRPRLQQYLTSHFQNGDFTKLVVFIGANSVPSDDLYEHLKFLGRRDYVLKLNDLIELLSRGPEDVVRARVEAKKRMHRSEFPASQARPNERQKDPVKKSGKRRQRAR